MNESNMSLAKVIASLQMSIEFGADEALNTTPRDRLAEQLLEPSRLLKRERVSSKKHPHASVKKDHLEKSTTLTDKIEMVRELVNKCNSVAELKNGIKICPYFIKNDEVEESTFYEGPPDPSIIIFKEPDIYFRQSVEEKKLFDRELLFARICGIIDRSLNKSTGNICGSAATFLSHWDNSNENKSVNNALMQPFLYRCIDLLKPKVVICQGGSWLGPNVYNGSKNKDILQNVLVVDFPSLDVLRRAPKRKHEVWIKILKLRNIF